MSETKSKDANPESSAREVENNVYEQNIVFKNSLGMHARPASVISGELKPFEEEKIDISYNGKTKNAKSTALSLNK